MPRNAALPRKDADSRRVRKKVIDLSHVDFLNMLLIWHRWFSNKLRKKPNRTEYHFCGGYCFCAFSFLFSMFSSSNMLAPKALPWNTLDHQPMENVLPPLKQCSLLHLNELNTSLNAEVKIEWKAKKETSWDSEKNVLGKMRLSFQDGKFF